MRFVDSLSFLLWRALKVATPLAWKLLVLLYRSLGFLVALAGRLVVPPRLLGRLEGCLDWLRNFLTGEPFSMIATLASDALDAIVRLLNRSAMARRWLLLVMMGGCVLAFYPPSHWGPWCLYEKGIASYYGKGFYFNKMADGDRLYPWTVAAAHRTLPLGTTVFVRNRENGRTAYLKIADRGPYVAGRVLDLSERAASRLGVKEKGLAQVEIYVRK